MMTKNGTGEKTRESYLSMTQKLGNTIARLTWQDDGRGSGEEEAPSVTVNSPGAVTHDVGRHMSTQEPQVTSRERRESGMNPTT